MSQIPMFESARSLHELYPRLLGNILDTGAAVSPRGQATYELSPMAFVLEDPTDCVRLPKARRVNQAYSIVEKLSLVHGVADPETFCFYIPSLRRLLDSEGVFGGAYGPRVARQLDYVYGVLREDPHSRRAVMTVFSSAVDHQPSNDVPCTLSLQFMMRDGLLSLFVSMRSSDVYLGLPYDVQQFTFLQQLMAHWLGVDVGSYVHFAASGHIYERDRESAERIVAQPDELSSRSEPPVDLDHSDARDQVAMFFRLERELREGRIVSPEAAPQFYLLGAYLQASMGTVARTVQRKAHSKTQLQLGLAV